jgi:hypothetical protein
MTDTTYPIAPMGLGIDTGGAPYHRCDDCSSLPMKLPFKFCFFGKEYDTVYISNKGVLTFEKPDFTIDSTGLPIKDTMMLAAYWSDIDNRTTNPAEPSHAFVFDTITATHMIVQWNSVPYGTFDHDNFNSFQVTITNGSDPILPPGNNVSYCYSVMQWASGNNPNAEGWDGIPAVVGVNEGDGIHYAQFGEFDTVILFQYGDYLGPFDTNSNYNWLDGRSFIFNTCVSGNTIPPVIMDSNPNLCNTYYGCPGDTISFATSFLCGQKGQTATLSESSDIIGITNTISNNMSIYKDATQLIVTLQDTGYHIITIVATDNSHPALKDSVSYTLLIDKNCADTLLGVTTLPIDNSNITLYPNPNHGLFNLEIRNGEALTSSNNTNSLTSNEELGIQNMVEVYNMLGEKVFSTPFTNDNSQFTIDLSSRPSGLYLYRIVNESGDLIGIGKFVIQ